MAQDDLNVWLKASAENKINQKNAWQATLIDHFVDTKQFNAQTGVNFQKASSTLEGCMKVYSNRVDEVSENTIKLLGLFNKDEEIKKKTTKKRSNFIEKNLNNINLREKQNEGFYDSLFSSILSKNEDYFLVDYLELSNHGLLVYTAPTKSLVMQDEKIELELEQLPICHSLKDFQSIEPLIENTSQEPAHFDIDYNEPDFDNIVIEKDDSNETERPVAQPAAVSVFQESPFGYFKGWAGPAHWKTNLNIEKKPVIEKVYKQKQRQFIDFSKTIDTVLLETKADTIMSREHILDRRKHKNFLPEDYSYETKDLYRFIIKDGYFAQIKAAGVQLEEKNSVVESFNRIQEDCNGFDQFEDVQDFNADVALEPDISFQLEKSLNLETTGEAETAINLKYTRVAKRVDIKKLKENVGKVLEKNVTRLSEIFKEVPQMYQNKEAKEISPHLCLISLLHLANEKGLQIQQMENDFSVKM